MWTWLEGSLWLPCHAMTQPTLRLVVNSARSSVANHLTMRLVKWLATLSNIPHKSEVIIVRLSEDLVGSGSALTPLSELPSRATRRNYHYAILVEFNNPRPGP